MFDIKNNAKIINAASKEIGKDAKGLAKRIHEHLISIAFHVSQSSGDVTVARNFVMAMKPVKLIGETKRDVNAVRVDAIVKWLKAFAFVSIDKDGNFTLNKKAFKDARGEDDFRAALKEGEKNPWNVYKPDANALGEYDVDKAIDRAIESIENALKEAKIGEGRFARQTPATREKNVYESTRLTQLLALKREKKAA